MVSTKEVKVVFWLQQVKLGKENKNNSSPDKAQDTFSTSPEKSCSTLQYVTYNEISYHIDSFFLDQLIVFSLPPCYSFQVLPSHQ